jgi:hypothetical protein
MEQETATLENISFDFPLEITKQAESEGEFHIVGYAATTDFDLQGDLITEEALRASQLDLVKNSTVLLNHDIKIPIGKVTMGLVVGKSERAWCKRSCVCCWFFNSNKFHCDKRR